MEQIEKVVGQLKIHHGEIEGLLKRVKNLMEGAEIETIMQEF